MQNGVYPVFHSAHIWKQKGVCACLGYPITPCGCPSSARLSVIIVPPLLHLADPHLFGLCLLTDPRKVMQQVGHRRKCAPRGGRRQPVPFEGPGLPRVHVTVRPFHSPQERSTPSTHFTQFTTPESGPSVRAPQHRHCSFRVFPTDPPLPDDPIPCSDYPYPTLTFLGRTTQTASHPACSLTSGKHRHAALAPFLN